MVPTSPSNSAAPTVRRRSFVLAAGGFAVAAPALLALRPSRAVAQARSALDLIKSAPAVSIFAEIIKNHGLEEEFSASGSFGFFIPVNGAIERVPALQVERFRGDKEYARKVVLNHITDFSAMINGFGGSEGTSESQRIRTKAGYSLTLVTGSGQPRLAGFPITYTNIQASNGYCHALDGVLMV
ncbi:fasciclin domain-containing protein [Roseomonas aerophila]|uniref:Fasciclin domain-containing protein n=1 Tax=Teichococcus aerophilus TaxID=1224513 RepID=A0ABR7RFX6_9PROT|nr:fasciclin domain-containing protein [Pseudoroseomonas aerophila]MBC9205228.1 fasciclin domain-containing protein [Pseudoroseomonas aerophila]